MYVADTALGPVRHRSERTRQSPCPKVRSVLRKADRQSSNREINKTISDMIRRMKKTKGGYWLETDQCGRNGLVGILEESLKRISSSYSGAWGLEVTGLGCPPLRDFLSYLGFPSQL